MLLQLLNTTENIITINDGVYLSLLPGSYTQIDTSQTPIDQSNQLVSFVSSGDLVINNYTDDLPAAEGLRWIMSGSELFKKDFTGKLIVHQSPKVPGYFVYWTGRGDDVTNNIVGKGESLLLYHKIGDPTTQTKYIDFHTIDNPTQIREGVINWCKCWPGDNGSCSIVTSVMPTEPGVNTNFKLYGGYLIVPAAGDGDIRVTGDMSNTDASQGCLVKVGISYETNSQDPGFWNAEYDEFTNTFTNITPAPYGDGEYNMFATEIEVVRFVNNAYLIDSGTQRLASDDADFLDHGFRLKLKTETSPDVEDHDWSLSVILTLQREKTV